MRLTSEQRHANNNRIRAVMDQLLSGQIPDGGRCDISTLARESGIDRTAFYGTRPYTHLREEFERRLAALTQQGGQPDPRTSQIDRLTSEVEALRQRLAQRDRTITELSELNHQALSQLSAQHDEIIRLRQSNQPGSPVRRLPTRPTRGTDTLGPCS